MKAIDFFCGAGGFTAGLRAANIDVIAGLDANPACEQAYTTNNPGSAFMCVDISALGPEALAQLLPGVAVGDQDLVFVGCAPCQPFSQQRRTDKPHRDSTLLGAFGRLVEAFRPGFVIVENVPGIAAVKGNSTYKRFLAMLHRNGYSVDSGIIDAKAFGVPQSRRRLVLVAARNHEVKLPPPTHGVNLKPWVTVRDAISHYPALEAGSGVDEPANHRAAALSDRNLQRMRHTPADGGSRSSWPEHLVLECHKGSHRGHSDVYGRMHWDEPAPTLTGRCHSLSNGRFGHPAQHRALSLREAAALQTFPDDYEFFGCMRSVALQIGNAVPVRLARILGEHVTSLSAKDDSPVAAPD